MKTITCASRVVLTPLCLVAMAACGSSPQDLPEITGTSTSAIVSDPVTSISVGAYSACAVTAAGGVLCWGQNSYGQLGNGTTTDSSIPVPVTGLASGVTSVSVGGGSACALTSSGGVLCWGYYSALGNGATTNSSTPVPVTGLASGVTSVSVGDGSPCAVSSSGAVCWGGNSHGELGNGTTTDSLIPVPVTGLTSGVTAVSVGTAAACAVTSGGSVLCWGQNSYGQLGNGMTLDSSIPVQVTGLTSGASSVSIGAYSACAVTSSGSVECWGYDGYGELGNGTVAGSTTPVQVGHLTGATSVSVGEASVCARTASGDALCWGENYNGQLGNGTMTNSSVPVQVTGLTSGVTSISVGDLSACAVISTGGAVCWGFNGYDELGTGTTTSSLVPVAVALPTCSCYTTTICVGGTQRVPGVKSPPNWCTGHLVSTTTCGCVPG